MELLFDACSPETCYSLQLSEGMMKMMMVYGLVLILFLMVLLIITRRE